MLAGASLDIDGDFGQRTGAAVVEFQRRHRLTETGEVDPPTWDALGARSDLVAVEHIDATHLDVLLQDGPYLDDGHATVHAVDSSAQRGVRRAIEHLASRHAPRSVSLLRFHGHGGPGHMIVSGGQTLDALNSFGGEYFRPPSPNTLALFGRLGSIMKPYGSIELHGCRVGAAVNGRRLLTGMASACGVPISGGVRSQRGGHEASRFEGPTTTICPSGQTLANWSRSVVGLCQD